MTDGDGNHRGRTPAQLSALVARRAPSDPPVEVVGAHGGFGGMTLMRLREAISRPMVVVVPDDHAARTLQRTLTFFATSGDDLDPIVRLEALDHVPFQGMSPSRLQGMERTSALFRWVHGLGSDISVIPARALLRRTAPVASLRARRLRLAEGDAVPRAGLLEALADRGYHPVTSVEDPGTFAVRGGILDVFSPLYTFPTRIEFWGDDVESLRRFDPETQRTVQRVPAVEIAPARDIFFDPPGVARAREALLDLADGMNVPSRRVRAMLDDVAEGILAVGMEDLLPAFHERLDTVFDALAAEACWVVQEPHLCQEAIRDRWDHAQSLSERGREDPRLVYPAERLYLPAEEAIATLDARTEAIVVPMSVEGHGGASIRFQVEDNAGLRREIETAAADQRPLLEDFVAHMNRWRERGLVVVICAHTAGGLERLVGLLDPYPVQVARHDGPFHMGLLPSLAVRPEVAHLFIGEPGQGFRSDALGLALVDERELLGTRAHGRRRRRQVAPEHALATWRDLREGDLVVHLLHGVGRYHGLTKTTVSGVEVDFLELEYAGGGKLFVPVDRLHLVSRHVGSEGATPALDKLGGTGWQRVTRRVRKAVRDIADRLLKLYAARALRRGRPCRIDSETMARFEAGFPWEETPDQADAIAAVLEDMGRDRPMDRLVCGDVGFGKTEVAMRAAFTAVFSGQQVAVLVPTLVLAEQHLVSFRQRFETFPVVIECLSRARTAAHTRDIRQRLAGGQVDVVIGTHRLLSKDIAFANLGLVIVDEEHRFGVTHKERLKEYRQSVHVLTLTATPIPRTLHMSMTGLRDISLIQTPPVDRLPIRTIVSQQNEQVIADAIERELDRGGQVFFVHNRVQDIEAHAELVSRIVPRARVVVAHGQMPAGHLEKAMLRFIRGEANVLVCTTIIESGLDIPNANTILLQRADRFGLAQLYQLRGRVGRASTRAYCYLLVPAPRNLDGDAKARIATIQRFSELGSGFQVASHDLDIRGAGELLGADQAGNIQAVGYDAYMTLLGEAIETQRAKEEARSAATVDPELKVALEGRIPERWLPDTTLRLRLYRALATASDADTLYEVFRGAVDRYGQPPTPVRNLVELMGVKIEARRLGMSQVGYHPSTMSFTLVPESLLARSEVITALLSRPDNPYRITPQGQLVRDVTDDEWSQGLEPLKVTIRSLQAWADAHR